MEVASEVLKSYFNLLEKSRIGKKVSVRELARRLDVSGTSVTGLRKLMKEGNTTIKVSSIVKYVKALFPEHYHVYVDIRLKDEKDLPMVGNIMDLIETRKREIDTQRASKLMGFEKHTSLLKLESKYKKEPMHGTYKTLWKYASLQNIDAVRFATYQIISKNTFELVEALREKREEAIEE